jgi:hypothetical protein
LSKTTIAIPNHQCAKHYPINTTADSVSQTGWPKGGKTTVKINITATAGAGEEPLHPTPLTTTKWKQVSGMRVAITYTAPS